MPTRDLIACDPIAVHLSRDLEVSAQRFIRKYASHLYATHLDTEEEDLAAQWCDRVEQTAQERETRSRVLYLHWPNVILPRACDACRTTLPHPTHYPFKRCQDCIDASPWSN